MPRIPTTRQQPLPNIPAPTGTTQLRGIPAGQGLQQAGQLIGEVTQRLRQQELEEQSAKLEQSAREQLTQAETQALSSPNFRQAPELYEANAQAIIQETVQQADPVLQEQLQRNLGKKAAITKAELRRDAIQKSRDEQVSTFRNFASQIGTDFATAETPQDRQALLDSLNERAEGLVTSGALSQPEAEGLANDARQNALEARAQQFLVDKKPEAARDYINGTDLPPERKRILVSLAESQARQNNSELRSMVGQVEQFVTARHELPTSVAGVPYSELQKRVEGTEFGDDLSRLEGSVSAIQSHVSRSVPEQQEALDVLRSQRMGTFEFRRFQMLAQATSRAREAVNQDPFGFAENRVIGRVRDLPIEQMATGQASESEVANILSERSIQADALSQYYGQPVSPLQPGEVSTLSRLVQQGDADTGTRILSQITGNLDFQSGQSVADALGDNNPIVGVAALLSPDAPEVTREILAGKDTEAEVQAPKQERLIIMDEVVGEALRGSPASRSAFMEAATSVYRNRAVKAGETSEFVPERFRKAVRTVMMGRPTPSGETKGGPMTINGTRTLPPKPGITEGEFQDAFGKLRDPVRAAEVLGNYATGLPGRLSSDGTLEQMPPADAAEATPIYVGRGRYMLQMPDGGLIHNLDPETKEPTGTPMILNMRAAFADNAFGSAEVGRIIPAGQRREAIGTGR